jgi:ubiquinone/menaquinone biosynthesis C-methylase UbiE
MLEKVEMDGKYWDGRYVNGGINLACPSVWKHIIGKFKSGTGTVLDVGCGVGLGLRLINLLHPEKKLYGLDVSNDAVQRVRGYLPGAEILCRKVPPIEYKDNFFDIVVCTEFLEHITDPLFALKEIRRVLKYLGTALITIPDDCLGSAKEHISQWNKSQFCALANSAGFLVAETKSFYVNENANYLFVELVK